VQRWVTDPDRFVATLHHGIQGQLLGLIHAALERNDDADRVLVDHDVTEELVVLEFRCGHLDLAQLGLRRVEFEGELVLVQVIAVGDRPGQDGRVGCDFGLTESEGLVRLQEFILLWPGDKTEESECAQQDVAGDARE